MIVKTLIRLAHLGLDCQVLEDGEQVNVDLNGPKICIKNFKKWP